MYASIIMSVSLTSGIFGTATAQLLTSLLPNSNISQYTEPTLTTSSPSDSNPTIHSSSPMETTSIATGSNDDVTITTENTRLSRDSDSAEDDDDEISITRWVLCSLLFVIIIFTMLGNMIVLVAPFVERRLRTTLIYFIMNLALTDLLVAVMAMDFYTIDVLLGKLRRLIVVIWNDYNVSFFSIKV